MNKKLTKLLIEIGLGVVIVILAIFCVRSIMIPIRFTRILSHRNEIVINRLKDIRTAEDGFKELNGRYTGSFDTLIDFVKNGKLKKVRAIGELTDEQLEAGITERKAIKLGLIIRDTIRVPAINELFPDRDATFNPENLRYVPFTKNQHQFRLGATTIKTESGLTVPVFEARVSNMIIFEDLMGTYGNEIREENGTRLSLNKYPGLKVGSITEINNGVGNWE